MLHHLKYSPERKFSLSSTQTSASTGAASERSSSYADSRATSKELPDAEVGRSHGFSTIPEPETIRIEERSVAMFSMPLEALTYEPDEEASANRFANGDSERMIHLHTKLTPAEEAGLRELQAEAARKGHSFYPSIAAAASRFLADAHGGVELALSKMLGAQEWRRNYFRDGPITEALVAEDMKYGVVYWTGRDRFGRPCLVLRPGRAPLHMCNDSGTHHIIRALVFCIEYFHRFLQVPGRVETMTLIFDLGGVSLKKVPLNTIREVHRVLTQQQPCRVARFYICGMSMMLSALSGVIQKLMTERQRNKVVFIKNVCELRKEFALHQLEKDLGGTKPVASEFLPFPLVPGPFDAGHSRGPRADATANLHHLLSEGGRLGRTWDPDLSSQLNQRLDFTDAIRRLPSALRLLLQLNAAAPTEEAALLQEEPAETRLSPSARSTPAASRSDEVEKPEAVVVEEDRTIRPRRSSFMCGAVQCASLTRR